MTVPYNFLAQKDGFRRLAYAGDYEEVVIGGVVTTGKVLREEPRKALRFLRATLRGLRFYRDNKLQSLRHMGEFLHVQDSQFLEKVYDYHRETLTETGVISSSLMVRIIEEAKHFTKTERDIKKEEIFDFNLLEKAAEEVKRTP